MSRKAILYLNPESFVWKARLLNTRELGSVMLLAMNIAENGAVKPDNNTKRRKWFKWAVELEIFIINDEGLADLNPELMVVKHKGCERTRGYISPTVRELIHELYNYRCAYCDTAEGPFHIDHIVPVSRGGGDEQDNLCLACVTCNLSKSNKLLAEWRAEQ